MTNTGTVTFEVVVGNVGIVFSGWSRDDAEMMYSAYVHSVDAGRAHNEPVTLMVDGGPIKEGTVGSATTGHG